MADKAQIGTTMYGPATKNIGHKVVFEIELRAITYPDQCGKPEHDIFMLIDDADTFGFSDFPNKETEALFTVGKRYLVTFTEIESGN